MQDNITYIKYELTKATLPYTLNKLPNGVADYIDVVNKVHVQRVEEIDLSQVNWITAQHNNSNYIGGYSDFKTANIYNKKFKRTSILFSGLEELKGSYIESLQDLAIRLNADDNAFLVYTIKKQKLLDAGIISSLDEYVNSRKLQSYFATLTNVKVYGELATPIYTPLTEEEVAQLPLSAYADGYVNLSSDQLMPSFEFRMRASNRYQVDMLETGYYYLDAPTGSVKLGTADVDVQQMPCIVKVDNVGTGDSGYRLGFDGGNTSILSFDKSNAILGYYYEYTGELIASDRDCAYEEYIPISTGDSILINQLYYTQANPYSVSVILYDSNKTMIKRLQMYEATPQKVNTANVAYFRFSCIHDRAVTEPTTKVAEVYINPITLAKLPSHRIPTTFTQGMKCGTDFGYWEGIKESKPSSFRTVNISDGWSIVESISIEGVILNRIEISSNSLIVEDELDIATGKFIKRIGKVVLDGSSDESWVLKKSNETYVKTKPFAISLPTKSREDYVCINNRIRFNVGWNSDSERLWINERSMVIVHTDKAFSVDDFRKYLASNPIIVYYPLEVPEISYVNLSSNQVKTVANTALQCPYINGYLHAQCKPSHLTYPVPSLVGNRTYTVVHNRKNINGSTKPIELNLGGTVVQLNDASSKTLVKTPSTLAHSNLIFIGGESTVDHVMVLDGDWTNKPIEYFENMMGHDTDAIITIIGNGQIDDVEEQYLW